MQAGECESNQHRQIPKLRSEQCVSRLMLGLNHRTSAYQVILAAYEAICFQTRDLIEAFVKDVPSWKQFDRITVGGEFSENPFLLQLLADLCGLKVERPQTTFPSCFGAMIAAGLTMEILTLEQSAITFAPPIEIFQPTMCSSSEFTSISRLLNHLNWINDFTFHSERRQIPHMEICNQKVYRLGWRAE